jgi:hypothetical protein
MHPTYLVVAKSLAAVICANERFPHLVDLDYARREHMPPGLAAAFMLWFARRRQKKNNKELAI